MNTRETNGKGGLLLCLLGFAVLAFLPELAIAAGNPAVSEAGCWTWRGYMLALMGGSTILNFLNRRTPQPC